MTKFLGLPGVGSLGVTDAKTIKEVHCAGWEPIYTSRNDTPETEDQAIKHNEFGEASGCPAFKPNS